jgi:hypothetical protein
MQGNVLTSRRTVKASLEENAAELTDVVNTGARQRLDDAIAELSRHASDQTRSALASQGPTFKQHTLREALPRAGSRRQNWARSSDSRIGLIACYERDAGPRGAPLTTRSASRPMSSSGSRRSPRPCGPAQRAS